MNKVLAIAFIIFGLTVSAMAASYNYVEQGQFKQWLEAGKNISIVDIQVAAEFRKQHFKGALETNAFPVKSAEDKQKIDKILPALAANQHEIVVICPRGGGGAKNTIDYLKEKGINEKRIFILKEGMQGWQYKELTISGR